MVRGALAACILAAAMSPAYTRADDSLPIVGTEAGATNPVGAADTNMFRDDELDILGAARDVELRFFPGAPTRDDLKAWNFDFSASGLDLGSFMKGQVTDNYGNSDYSYPITATAYGRVTDPEHDQLVIAGIDAGTISVPQRGIDVQIRTADGSATVLKSWLQQLNEGPPIEGVDVAVGDLDGLVDEKGYLHDEIVVVFGRTDLFGGCSAGIAVYDYTFGLIASHSVPGCTGHVATTIGDFNGDGKLEIAAVTNETNDPATLHAQVCSLIFDPSGEPSPWHLECLPEYALTNAEKFPSLDVAAGNVLGVDKEEIVLVTSPGAASSTINYFNLIVLGVDNGSLYQSFQSRSSQIGGGTAIPYVHEARVAAGLFHYDPLLGYDFGNRQIVTAALGISSGSQTADVWFVDFSGTGGAALAFAKAHTSTSGRHTAKPSLAVGNFVGQGVNGDQTDPTMQAALTYLLTTSDNLTDGTRVTQKSAVWKLVPSPAPTPKPTPTPTRTPTPTPKPTPTPTVTTQESSTWNLGLPASGSTTWSASQASSSTTWSASQASSSITWSASQVWSSSLATHYGFDGYDPFVVTADYDGNSWRLGPPFHITFIAAPTINSLIEEPPRHVDYLPVDPDDLSKGYDVINVSAYKDFKVQLKETSGTTIDTGKTDTTNWSVGGGLDVSGGIAGGYKGVSIKDKIGVHGQAKLEGNYDKTVKDINKTYGEEKLRWTNSTELDDQLDVTLDDTDIWRYPIIGFETGDANNPVGYYEITIPGTATRFSEGGTTFEWFTPLHVNENVLSYPQNLSSRIPWIPSDLGSFKKPVFDDKGNPEIDPDTGKPIMEEVTAVMNDEIVYAWDGNDHTQEIKFNTVSGTSHQKEFMSTIGGSGDVGIGIDNKVKAPIPGGNYVEYTFTADLSVDGKYSWGDETVASTLLSDSTGLTFTIPSISAWDQRAATYSFTTAVYASTGQGGLRVAHTIIDLTSAPRDWWVKQYGRAPDPALNLPFRFTHHDPDVEHHDLEWWELKTAENDPYDLRHQMRGFVMRNDYQDPVTGNYELISGNPVDGKTVRLCARVHNFSLGQPTGNFDASFYYYGWNSQTGKAVDPRTGVEGYNPVWVGNATVASLDGLSTPNATTWREVCVPWDTSGLSQVAANSGYRFLVNLDEADVVKNEIHELKDAQGHEALGGNNSGRWPWINAVAVNKPEVASAPPPQGIPLSQGDIAIQGATGFLEGDAVELKAGETYALRGHMVSETPYSGNVWVAFFDGKPREGGKLIALEIGRGLQEGDNYIWARWTPKTPGEHELRAYAFHKVSAANREGTTASRLVTVVQAETPTPTPTPLAPAGEDDDSCSLATGRGSRLSGAAGLVLLGFVCVAVRVLKRRSARRGRGRQ